MQCGLRLQPRERVLLFVPTTHANQDKDTEHCGNGEPGHARLSAWQDDKRRQQRSDCRTGIASYLKERLCKPMPAAGGHTRNTRGLRMKDRRTDTHQRSRKDEPLKGRSHSKQQQTKERECHTDRERVRARLLVRVMAYKGLQ